MSDFQSQLAEIESRLPQLEKLGIRPITLHDLNDLQGMLNAPSAIRYVDTITYILQQTHGHYFRNKQPGFVYRPNADTIIPVGMFVCPHSHEPVITILNPRGKVAAKHILELVREIKDNCDLPFLFLLRHLDPNIQQQLNEIARIQPWTGIWHHQSPYEDDTFPAVQINVSAFEPLKSRNLRQTLSRLDRQLKDKGLELKQLVYQTASHAEFVKDAQQLVKTFFQFKREKDIDVSRPEDYRNMIALTPDLWGRPPEDFIKSMWYCGDQPIALVCAERIGNSDSFGAYSNLCLYALMEQKYGITTGLSEWINCALIAQIDQMGGTRIELGGAEGTALQAFRTKFLPEGKRTTANANLFEPCKLPWWQLDA